MQSTKNLFCFSPVEVWNALTKLPKESASGPNQISNCSLKRGRKILAINRCRIYNMCARIKYFPKQWKSAAVIMLPKAGIYLKISNNHRPISLLDNMEKLFEKFLLIRLKIYIMPLLRTEQFSILNKNQENQILINNLKVDIILFSKTHFLT